MAKLMKPGRVVIVLTGRRAGRKGIIVQCNENVSKRRPYANCLIAGIDRYPSKVTRKMSKEQIKKRLRIKPFVKYVNVNHLMPTRYVVTGRLDPKALVTDSQMESRETRKEARMALKAVFEEALNTPDPTEGKITKDALFLRQKLKF
ncbi:putative large subunit ribosomal protein L27e [Babesia bovis T2Bo]|uniref:Ribosomal L27e protein family protein n=1 Tax=Babesia bovis TaxID=5865 RepID=A7APY6_BABBO|nr:putative large subunit ribosomal protein L27e [Babesia bovis T2Bo]EDO08620.1 putative large subunit ribosomal protein L27e [Babesia bovis T2Bo]|eukprot:XP_001612188.1 ribosomal L27e protein family protein [Babesia bovis T2Bo]